MRSTRHLVRIVSVSALLVAGIFGSKSAHAEADTFGIGSGRSGALTVAAANTVVNGYASITATVAVGATTVTVDDGATFAAGDLVMLWQTSGLTAVPLSGLQTPIDVSLLPTGAFEYARVKSISGNVVTLTNPIVTPLGFVASTTQVAQMVRIPEYTTVSVPTGKSIVATPWNGAKGGIVVFFANGTVTNNASINADAAGYRGGVLVDDPTVSLCAANDGPVVETAIPSGINALAGGAKKGEGFYPPDYSTSTTSSTTLANAVTYGRGNITLGGGGGDCFNSGGGGGGNAGQGGLGGATATTEIGVGGGSRAVGGLGGGSIDIATYSALSRLTLGGGAGAGEEDSALGSAGATGGGVVLLRISALAGAGTVSADGAAGAASTTDGAGGGGAGGVVAVLTAANATCGGLHANGGVGGAAGTGFGPGGGGGGGFVLLQAASQSCSEADTGGSFGVDGTASARSATAGGAGSSSTIGTGFTGTCDITLGTCGGCTIDSDCAAGTVCDPLVNLCVDIGDGGLFLPDGGITLFPDGGLLLPDGGTLLPDGGLLLLDAGTLADGGVADGGSGADGGFGSDGGLGSDGGSLADGGSIGGGDGGDQTGGLDESGELDGGGCSTSGSSDSEGAALLGLGLVAALAFVRRKRR
jgi:MYXO-CTERM domain-containing protein